MGPESRPTGATGASWLPKIEAAWSRFAEDRSLHKTSNHSSIVVAAQLKLRGGNDLQYQSP